MIWSVKNLAISCLTLVIVLSVLNLEIVGQQRIRFRRGASSATVTGNLGCDVAKEYIIGAKEGQKMTIVLWSKGATATVWNKWGTKSEMGSDTQTMDYFFGYTGDVTISLFKPCGGGTDYRLKVRIR